MQTGKVYLVGAGPADVGLLTLRGKELIERADVVVYDALVGQAVLGLIPESTRRIDVGKRAGEHPVPQQRINMILLEEALSGSQVVRLKGGDPFLFGRGGEELELLEQNGIPFEVVPGVSSAAAVPAYAGIPLTHRDFCSSVHIITGQRKSARPPEEFEALVRAGGTLVFLMGVGGLEQICTGLTEAGMPPETPAALIERGTTARQRRLLSTVAALPEEARQAGVRPPAVLMVGEVCRLSERFSWAEKRPLHGKKILVTRPREMASRLTGMLREAGAEVIEIPAIRTVEIPENPALDLSLDHVGRYGWLVLTSPSGARIFFERLRRQQRDVRMLGEIRLAAIGAATAREIEAHGLFADLVPERFSAAALGTALAQSAGGTRVLIVRAREGSPDLTAELERAGIPYDDLPLYDTVYESAQSMVGAAMLDAGEVDYVAFTSASTVQGFVRAIGARDYSGIRAACIGEATARAAQACGMQVVVAEQATMQSLVQLMTEQTGNKEEPVDG